MKFAPFQYARPATLADAVQLLVDGAGDARVVAGGQSLFPMMAFRLVRPSTLVDLADVNELRALSADESGITIGALVRWCDIESSSLLAEKMPLLVEAMDHVAHYQIRNRGTIGGSLAHCDPAAEMPAIAVACDARIVIAGATGVRETSAVELLADPLSADLAFDEIITAVRFPLWSASRRWGITEISRRRGDFAMAGAIVHYDVQQELAHDVHVVVFGAAEMPRRLTAVEQLLEGTDLNDAIINQAEQALDGAIDPSDDIHASAEYRMAVAKVMLRKAIEQAKEKRSEVTRAR